MSMTIVTATPPTPNGDLHLGHLSGPYFAADSYTRYLRSRRADAVFVSSSDINQSYVVTTAQRRGDDPLSLAQRYTRAIRQTLERSCIETDVFSVPDDGHVRFVQSFFRTLYEAGKLTAKEKPVFFNETTGNYAFESFLSGWCPNCFAPTAGAICEACGHPNDSESILQPKWSLDGAHELTTRTVPVMVLELEKYREPISKFFAGKSATWRPHILKLVDELLQKPLPDFPITYVSDWGVPAPFPGFGDSVINVWAEMLPGLMRSTAIGVAGAATEVEADDELWLATHGHRLVQFLGYDNSFFFAIAHLALLMAHEGKYVLPHNILTNEFYELESSKFSTSQGHVIWARDLLEECEPDTVRFYLALTNPEFQKTNFMRADMDRLVQAKLLQPWNNLVDTLNKLNSAARLLNRIQYPVPPEIRQLANNCITAFERCYSIETFSLQRAAELTANQLSWLCSWSESLVESLDAGRPLAPEIATAPWLFVRLLPALVRPLMPEFADRLSRTLGNDKAVRWPTETDTETTMIARLPHGLLRHEVADQDARLLRMQPSG
jgi:methionyl-tRNA synthetase